MNEYLLAVYVWSAMSLVGLLLPLSVIGYRALSDACDGFFSGPERLTPSLPSVPLPSYPSSPG